MDLTPTTDELGDLLVRMTQEPWPATETERHLYFARLGLRDLGPFEADLDAPDTSRGRFATSLPGDVDGTCTVYRGQLLGLTLSAYTERIAEGPRAKAGYAGIQESLSHAIGRPVEEWGTATEPACMWRPGLLLLDMYCFQRDVSSIMVGPSHAQRSAAHDAAHRAAPRPRPSGSALGHVAEPDAWTSG